MISRKKIMLSPPKFILCFWDFALFLIPLLLCVCLGLMYWKNSYRLNDQGIRAMKKKQASLALEYFSQSLESDPFRPWPHLNMALSYDLNNQPLEAIKIYNYVGDQFSSSAQFFSYFNKGALYGRIGSTDEALENYQLALEYQYKTKEVKKNIELLFQSQKKDKQSDSKNKENQKNKPSDSENKKEPSEDEKDQNTEDKKESSKGEEGQDSEDKKEESMSEEKNNLEKSSENKENQGRKNRKELGELTDAQEQAILNKIEQQEGKIRAKTFKEKSRFGDKSGKDW